MTRALAGAIPTLLAASFAFGQTASAPPAFEVASVKPAPPPTGPGMRIQMGGDAGRINYSNVTLKMLLAKAYNVKEHQISGPDWINSERYDVVAKIPDDTPKDQVPLMLQALLTERFQMKSHRETKVMPVYELVVAKGGPKLTKAESEGRFGVMMGPRGRKAQGNTSMAKFADLLSNMMDRPVLDKTGLEGTYEISMEWTPDGTEGNPKFGPMMMKRDGPMGPRPEGGGPAGRPDEGKSGDVKMESNDGPDAPSIFAALQQKLGLKLEAKKTPAEMVVIDHAEKVPTEN